MSIPKIIHYCWFGGNIPAKFEKYIDQWRKKCPDYELKLWNENSFDLSSVEYLKKAVKAGRWAFVADYVRLAALYQYGGIYLDTDVELLGTFDSLLDQNLDLKRANKSMVQLFWQKKKIPSFVKFLICMRGDVLKEKILLIQ